MIQTEQKQRRQREYNDCKRKVLLDESAAARTTAVHSFKRRKVSDEPNNNLTNNTKENCDFYDHPFSYRHSNFHKNDCSKQPLKLSITEMTSNNHSKSIPDPPSTSSHIRQEEIDQLRSRVDSVLKNLVKSTEVDTEALKSQVQSLRDVPSSGVNAFDQSRASSLVSGGSSLGENDNTNQSTHLVEQQWIVDPYGDQGEFQGELNADNLPHGTGIMKYSDGRVYAGEWKGGRWHGKGRATFSNGDVFEGMYYEDQRHGLGIYQWSDGREFKGGFVNDQRSGHGEYTWPDGAKYSGEFQKGLRHGEGTYTFSDGSFYKGSWKQGKYHGKGECFWSDGRVYKGDWENGKAHGYGKEVRPDGSIRHDGKWENDKPVRDP